jgi:hypothetical protein
VPLQNQAYPFPGKPQFPVPFLMSIAVSDYITKIIFKKQFVFA